MHTHTRDGEDGRLDGRGSGSAILFSGCLGSSGDGSGLGRYRRGYGRHRSELQSMVFVPLQYLLRGRAAASGVNPLEDGCAEMLALAVVVNEIIQRAHLLAVVDSRWVLGERLDPLIEAVGDGMLGGAHDAVVGVRVYEYGV
jgi:hypothetical protein